MSLATERGFILPGTVELNGISDVMVAKTNSMGPNSPKRSVFILKISSSGGKIWSKLLGRVGASSKDLQSCKVGTRADPIISEEEPNR